MYTKFDKFKTALYEAVLNNKKVESEALNSDANDGSILVKHDPSSESLDSVNDYINSLYKASDLGKSVYQNIIGESSESLNILGTAFAKRKELDSGELRKEKGWYYGKGAWRINSNKVQKLGKTPSFIDWFDPMHEEVIEVYFPELLNTDAKSEDNLEDAELDNIELDDMLKNTGIAKPEMAMAENYIYKHINKKINESAELDFVGPSHSKAVAVTPKDLEAMIVKNYLSPSRRPLMIFGAPAIGKTTIVKQAAKTLGALLGNKVPVVITTLATMQPYDLNGVPLVFSNEGGDNFVMQLDQRGKIFMDFAVPAWLPGEDDNDEGLLFFDEINRATKQMLGAALTLLLDRKSNQYTMPVGWRVVAAGNRSVDGAVTPMELAVSGRFLGGIVHLVPTVEDWCTWARSDYGYYKGEGGKGVKQGKIGSAGYEYRVEADDAPDEFYIPEEFLGYLRTIETKPATSKWFDTKGMPIQTNFKAFYVFDKELMAPDKEGLVTGVASPRNWAVLFEQVYINLLTDPKYYDASIIDPKLDGRFKAIAGFSLMVKDRAGLAEFVQLANPIVGVEATTDFVNYIQIIARHNDHNGTITEKIQNIFKGVGKTDPLKTPILGSPKIDDQSERYAILGLVESTIKGAGTSFSMNNLLNWTNWVVMLLKEGNISAGELGAHVNGVSSPTEAPHVSKLIKQAATATQLLKSSKSVNGANRAVGVAFKEFADNFKDKLQEYNGL